MQKRKPGAGKKPLSPSDETKFVAFKSLKSIDEKLKQLVKELKREGFEKANKSKLIRALIVEGLTLNPKQIYKRREKA